MKEQVIKKLSDVQHVIYRPSMYVGAMDHVEFEDFFINEEDKFEFQKIKYIPGFLKIIMEIIDNSVDEATRTNYKFANKIKVKVDEKSVEVYDNGRGIPVKNIEGTDIPMPVMAFTHAKSGSNFEDDDSRTTIGMNGIGSFCTNVFSTYFKVVTSDGSNKCTLYCRDNLKEQSHSIRKCDEQFTEVYFEPDLPKFKLKKIDEIYQRLIKQRLLLLSLSHPEIDFSFNGKRMQYKNTKQFCDVFASDYELYEDDNFFISVSHSSTDDFRFFTYVNGLHLKQGGNHINIITTDIVTFLREKLSKYKGIMPGDIKNKIQVVVLLRNFKNMKFDSQTKEFLSNSTSDIREYLNLDETKFDNFLSRISKNDSIIEPIIEVYKIKEELKKRQEASSLLKNQVKVKNDKYMPPVGDKKYLVLAEGASAVNSISSSLGRRGFGYFELKGKPLNTHEESLNKVLLNEEFKVISQILNVKLDNESDMTYENILIASDQDLDGILIRGLLVAFFNKFCSNLLKDGKIKYLKTPMIVAFKGKEIHNYFFNFSDYNKYKEQSTEKLVYKYYKGLGTWNDKDLKSLFIKHGVDSFIETFEPGSHEEVLNNWLSKKTSDIRKEMMRELSFDIEKI